MPIATQGKNISSSAQVNPGVIEGSDIAADAVTNPKVADDAVQTENIKDGEIVNADISASAAIADSKLAEIGSANKVNGTSFKNLAGIPAGAGVIPTANLPATGEWGELGETTLGADAATLSVASFAARKYLMIVIHIIGRSVDNNMLLTFNSDTGTNYTSRTSLNGGADATVTGAANIDLGSAGTAENANYVIYIINLAAQEKLGIAHLLRTATAGSGTAPERREMVLKWANTAAQITTITLTQTSGNLLAGCRMTVYGTSD